jgi:hypothetical protein
MIRRNCPPVVRWESLLGNAVTADEQEDLQTHLDSCTECQRALESCAADEASWAVVPGWLRSRSDSHLLSAIEKLKQTPGAASDSTDASLDFLEPSDQPGVLGRLDSYSVIEEIGRGGMGIVLKALDPSLHRVVAIKVLAPQLAVSGSARKRFTREARLAAAVSHEHVVTIHAVEDSKPLPYSVMQYVAGQSLQQKLDKNGPLPVEDIVRIGLQAAHGLAAAHAQGLVHRDIKPANILLENGVERVRLSDFGLARTIEDVGVTHSGVIIGTPQYMAPEQARGQPLDERADLFSLGSVLYAMCTGRAPFRGNVALDVLRKVGDETPLPIRRQNAEIPAWLEGIVAKLMAKDPNDRFRSATEVAELLERCLAHVQNPAATALPAIPGHSERLATLRRIGPKRRVALALSLLAAILVATEATGYTRIIEALGTFLRFSTPEGTLVVEIDDPAIKVTLDDKDLVIQGAGVQEIRLKPGSYTLRATKDGQSKSQIVSVSRGGRETVKVAFEADAKPPFAWMTGEPRVTKVGIYFAWALAQDTRIALFFPSGQNGDAVAVWDVHAGKLQSRLALPEAPPKITISGQCCLAVSSDGQIAALAIGDKSVLWGTGSPAFGNVKPIRLKASTVHEGGIAAIALDGESRHVATAGKTDGVIRIWSIGGAYEVRKLEGFKSPDHSVLALSKDGSKLLASDGHVMRVWNFVTLDKDEYRSLDGEFVIGAQFLADGRVIAKCGSKFLIWPADFSQPPREVGSFPGRQPAFAITPDGRGLISVDENHGKSRIWLTDVTTGRDVKHLAVDGSVYRLSVGPGGRSLCAIVADKNGMASIYLWEMDLSWIPEAKQ